MKSIIAAAASLAALVGLTTAFTVSSPSSETYWVSNHTNTLNWKAESTDPDHFSVQLLNANQSALIGNFQIGNALTTANGTAQIQLDAIPAGQYTLLFVNSSNYELDHPQVYFTSDSFEIKPNGTQPDDVQANINAQPNDSSSTQTGGSSAEATLSSGSGANAAQPSSETSNASSSSGNSAGAGVTLNALQVMSGAIGVFSVAAFTLLA